MCCTCATLTQNDARVQHVLPTVARVRQCPIIVRQPASSLALLSVLCTLIGSPAAAEEPNESDEVAQLVELVAPDLGSVEQLATTDTAFVSETASVPLDPDKPVVLDGGGASGLEVSLPPEALTGHGEMAQDGTVVYASNGNNVDVAAQVLENNTVRIQTIIGDPSAPHEFTYQLGNGYLPIRAADGSLWAYRFAPDGKLELYGIGEAWARGADGAEISTYYEIRGDTVAQVVLASNANGCVFIATVPAPLAMRWLSTRCR